MIKLWRNSQSSAPFSKIKENNYLVTSPAGVNQRFWGSLFLKKTDDNYRLVFFSGWAKMRGAYLSLFSAKLGTAKETCSEFVQKDRHRYTDSIVRQASPPSVWSVSTWAKIRHLRVSPILIESGRCENTEGLLRGQKSSFVKTKVTLMTPSMILDQLCSKKEKAKMTRKAYLASHFRI